MAKAKKKTQTSVKPGAKSRRGESPVKAKKASASRPPKAARAAEPPAQPAQPPKPAKRAKPAAASASPPVNHRAIAKPAAASGRTAKSTTTGVKAVSRAAAPPSKAAVSPSKAVVSSSKAATPSSKGAAPPSKAATKTVRAGAGVSRRAASAAQPPQSASSARARLRGNSEAGSSSSKAQRTPLVEPEPRLPKSRLVGPELEEFRRLLLDKRAELVGNVNQLSSEALRGSQPGGAGNLSNVPLHMADISSDNWEQSFTLSLMETEQHLLKEIDAALKRIDDGTYGVCEATGKPITKRRLRATPWARYCIEYAREREMGRARVPRRL